MRNTLIHIHPDALRNNLNIVKKKLKPTTKILAMVKADAYGHGVTLSVPALLAADGFGVACLSEGLAVKQTLNNQSFNNAQKMVVLIEGVFDHQEWLTAISYDFSCVIHNNEQLSWALSYPANEGFARIIWLKYNTGMNRLGFDNQTMLDAAKKLYQAGYQLILTSHFACADDKDHPLNTTQIAKFNQMLEQIRSFAPKTQGSLCNSAGIFNFKDQHHDWVRAGIALYGSKPIKDKTAQQLGLSPAMTLSAQVIAIHHLSTEESVGYGALWIARTPCRIAIVSIGYGDGYPRVVNNAQVGIVDRQGVLQLCSIVGRVAMDMLMVKIDGLDINLGATVVLWGSSPTIDDVAQCADTIGYELMCRPTTRPKRQTINLFN